jgi:branched-chain amino acid transport system permease protein
MRWRFPAISLAVAVGLIGLPFVWPAGLELSTVILFWIGLAGCWNLMSGYTGYIDFGSATYVGVGSYAAGIMMTKVGWGMFPAVGAAGLVCAFLALMVGYPTLRLRGAYFAIATFALAEAMQAVAEEWSGLTGGGIGLTIPMKMIKLGDLNYYFLYLGLAAFIFFLTLVIDRGRMGFALKAIHQNEHAAAQVGVNTHSVKMTAYCLSAFLIGILGSLDAIRVSGYFIPKDVFDVHITIEMVIINLLGGMGTVLGPVVGASFLQIIKDFLGARFEILYLVIIGGVIVVIIMFWPRGIVGSLRGVTPRWRRR